MQSEILLARRMGLLGKRAFIQPRILEARLVLTGGALETGSTSLFPSPRLPPLRSPCKKVLRFLEVRELPENVRGSSSSVFLTRVRV
jgi:hypothetical protein